MKILIVDDSSMTRSMLLRLLEQAGFTGHEFAEAENGSEGYDKAKEWKPDLILCDWIMPRMNGIDLLKKLRAEGDMVPLGFITAMAQEHWCQLASDAGALFLIPKPFTLDNLKEELTDLLT